MGARRSRISQREYARRRGVSHTAVRKAIAEGRIHADQDGRVDPVEADRLWKQRTDVTKPLNSVTGNPQHKRPRGGPPIPVEPKPARGSRKGSTNGNGNGHAKGETEEIDYLSRRSRYEDYRARLLELEFLERTSKLVAVDDVEREAFDSARRVRERLSSIPERLAPVVAGLDDIGRIEELLEGEIRSALEELSSSVSGKRGRRSQ